MGSWGRQISPCSSAGVPQPHRNIGLYIPASRQRKAGLMLCPLPQHPTPPQRASSSAAWHCWTRQTIPRAVHQVTWTRKLAYIKHTCTHPGLCHKLQAHVRSASSMYTFELHKLQVLTRTTSCRYKNPTMSNSRV